MLGKSPYTCKSLNNFVEMLNIKKIDVKARVKLK